MVFKKSFHLPAKLDVNIFVIVIIPADSRFM